MLVLRYIYQKQKTGSVYLILKNNYGPFSENNFKNFKNFPDRNSKNDDVIKYMPPFYFFFYETNDNMLVIMHAKFEVNSCCG